MRILIAVLLLVLLPPAAAHAQFGAPMLLNGGKVLHGGTALADGFYVATNGTSNGICSLAQPCTLAAAQTAMQNSATKRTYVRAGTYTGVPSQSGCASQGQFLHLTSTDNNTTYQYYPPDGVNTAIFDGGSSGNSGIEFFACVDTASGITINGLQMQHFVSAAVLATHTSNFTYTNNKSHDITRTSGGQGTINFWTIDCVSCTITHNFWGAMPGGSIRIDVDGANAMDNTIIGWNYAEEACVGIGDCGSFYFDMFDTVRPASGIQVKYNYIRGCTSTTGGCHAEYLDSMMSNMTSFGNVFRGNITDCGFDHGGSNHTSFNEICENGLNQNFFVVQENIAGQTINGGNTFSNSIYTIKSAGAGGGMYAGGGSAINVGPNIWYNYTSPNNNVNISGNGAAGNSTDSNPRYVDPQFDQCPGGGVDSWSYTLRNTSPAFNSPINFPAQPANDLGIAWGMPGYWGPPGFTIPHTGPAPAYGPTC